MYTLIDVTCTLIATNFSIYTYYTDMKQSHHKNYSSFHISSIDTLSHFYQLFFMACQKAPLKLDMKDVVYVKPFKPTPSTVLPLSTLDSNKLYSDSICQSVHVYQSANHDSPHGQLDPAYVFKEALSKALFYYYPLAGKVVKQSNGKLAVSCNNADGVSVLEAIANCELSSLNYLDDNDIEIAKHLVFDFPSQIEIGYQHLVAFKVTKFLCGGFTIGMSASHIVCDGSGISQFFRAIAEIASGKSEPSVKPVWERERLVGSITTQPIMQSSMDDASAAVSPFLPATDVLHECFKVDGESITRLKMSLMKGSDIETMEQSFTTFETLAAYVWRSRARALKLNNDGKTLLIIAVGVRRHLDPPLPDGYYGNAIVDAKVVLTVRELNERPLSEIVKLMRETKNVAFTSDYFRKTINNLETKQEYFNIEDNGATMALTEWKHLGFTENKDFGWKEPVNLVPARCNMFRSVVFCIFSSPSNLDPSMKGGVRIFISLPSAAMTKFREEMEALSLTKP